MELNRQLKSVYNKKDKNGNDFLVLKTDNDEVIFVFPKKVSEDRWNWLNENEDRTFTFIVEEGKEDREGNTTYVLQDYSIEVGDDTTIK
jgi:hypothetical protein